MRRHKLSSKKSKKLFRRGAKTNVRNFGHRSPMRGGIRF
jgi:hypothetical protein